MKKEMKQLVRLYPRQSSKAYVLLKNLLTPFGEIDSSIPKKGKILDIGCGIGMYSFYLKLRAPQRTIVGIDNNIRRIRYANSIAEHHKLRLKFWYADLNRHYEIERYDAYLINDVLHHIPNKSKEVLLKKIFHNMRKKDVLVIKEMHFRSKPKFNLNYINDKIMTLGDELYFIDRLELTTLLREIGFKVESKEIDGYIFPHIIYVCRKY
jgi:2-polyprenyl-3-methyl-5-hydroxy-6-metoxy-1,4-benzoquinol methylase